MGHGLHPRHRQARPGRPPRIAPHIEDLTTSLFALHRGEQDIAEGVLV
jgi:hypothetical protein